MIFIEFSPIKCNVTILLPYEIVFFMTNVWNVLTRYLKLDMMTGNKRVSSYDTYVPFIVNGSNKSKLRERTR
jgi:hypothetical protein